MFEIVNKAFEDIDKIEILLQLGVNVMEQSQIKNQLLSLEKKIDEICRLDLPEKLKLDLIAALKKLLRKIHLS
ncbi:hypothetical protein [Neorickettsia findlayensis]|uniref:Uncharacterized protein n=1 Tax=Neorickettsia findlayensis TaxID=2686014 RepID=A0A6P1GAV1_9RICK|nr:hypothetical protein [Neorickettsia findlayensis]QHD65304.1 hypothetical protein GP480_02495 [Neorickettsia findlayensis]